MAFFNSFSFIYSTTFSARYFCSKLRKTKMKWLQSPPPPPLVPVYIEFTVADIRSIFLIKLARRKSKILNEKQLN